MNPAMTTRLTLRNWYCMLVLVACVVYFPAQAHAAEANLPKGITEKSATVNGVTLNYKIGGSGPVVVLLHGYAQTSHMWLPLMPLLAKSHTVIAPDLRGAGDSERTPGGYDKKTLAQDIHALVGQLGYRQVQVVGHDIGLMVAYAYAAQYPGEVSKVILMDAFLPGVGDWTHVWLLRDLWHFHFHGETPLALVKGRERIYFEHFWNDFAADRTRSIPETDRRIYAAAYAKADGMRAGFEYFKAFEQDANDFEEFSATRLDMPFFVIAGEKASGTFLVEQTKLVANDVTGMVVKNSGHWLIDEAPDQVIPMIVAFVNGEPARKDASLQRLTPVEIEERNYTGAGAGTSGVLGIQTIMLSGDPTRSGPYTILLKAPANTRIEAHAHPDDRVATVISGTWYFGYGARFDEQSLKALPPGSFYTEPSDRPHFARTGDAPVVIHITGYGPTGTRYAELR